MQGSREPEHQGPELAPPWAEGSPAARGLVLREGPALTSIRTVAASGTGRRPVPPGLPERRPFLESPFLLPRWLATRSAPGSSSRWLLGP